MNLTYTQCKQISQLHSFDWRGVIQDLQDQPEWLRYAHGLYNAGADNERTRWQIVDDTTSCIDLYDVLAIQQGGCASGAFMPAVTYWSAVRVMGEYGDEILEYLDGSIDLGSDFLGESWSGMAVWLLSAAVELWCSQFDLDGVNWD